MRLRLPRSPMIRAGLVLLGLLLLVAVAAPLLAPYDPRARTGRPFSAPSGEHLLGTNDIGQDLLSGFLYGTRVSLLVGVAAAATATLVGAVVGLYAGYRRGWPDALLMRLIDTTLALPLLPLIIVMGVFMGPGVLTQVIVIAGVLWAATARELRSQVLSTRELDHVQWSRAMGARTAHVIRHHVLPEVSPLLIPQFLLAVRTAILLEAALSFLGLGDVTAQSWGTMLHYAQARGAFLTDAWLWWVVPPGIGIAAAVLGFAFVGYGLEELARPRRGARARIQRHQPAPPVTVATGDPGPAVLVLDAVRVEYTGTDRPTLAADGVSISIAPGEVVGLVGASGSGKSTLVMAAAGLLRPPARLTGGRVLVEGVDLAALSVGELRQLHGNRVGLVPQQAMDALNPVFRVGDQVAEAITVHRAVTKRAADERARQLLEQVGIADRWADHYPHELSGGMRQRAVIAMAMANDPALLIADEPTTGLDLVLAKDLLDLLARLSRARHMAVLVVSHDLPAVMRVAERLVVMQGGRIVEQGLAATVAAAPSHPYTRALLQAVPRLRLAAGAG
jgi:peptide/nickel transport system permease protein